MPQIKVRLEIKNFSSAQGSSEILGCLISSISKNFLYGTNVYLEQMRSPVGTVVAITENSFFFNNLTMKYNWAMGGSDFFDSFQAGSFLLFIQNILKIEKGVFNSGRSDQSGGVLFASLNNSIYI